MSIHFLFAWYDMWIGAFWDSRKRRLYIFPVPCLGFYVQFPPDNVAFLAWKLKWLPVQRIRDADGKLLLTRVKLTPQTRWGQLCLHVFHASEKDMPMHDHGYDYWTIPLNQNYWEEVAKNSRFRIDAADLVRVRRWTLNRRPAEHIHRVVECSEGWPLITLFWGGKQRRQWGFHTADGWTYWKTWMAQNAKK